MMKKILKNLIYKRNNQKDKISWYKPNQPLMEKEGLNITKSYYFKCVGGCERVFIKLLILELNKEVLN